MSDDRAGERWTTRVGGPTGAAASSEGEDLAALQREQAGRAKRVRVSVAEREAQHKAQRREQLRRQAASAQRRRRLRAAMTDPKLLALIVVVALAALTVTVIAPALTSLLNPPLSKEQLIRERATVDLQAAKALGVSVTPAITASADSSAWLVTYRVRSGQRDLRGRKVRASCEVTFRVDRARSQVGRLVIARQQIVRCRH